MERLAQTNRTRGMSASALRLAGYFCLLAGVAGKGLIQHGMLGLTGLDMQQMMGVLEQSSEAMTLATVSIVLQALETCAVPIFAFLLVEGFQKTASYQHYLTRMILVALASEIPYNLAFGGRLFVMDSRNPVFAMVLSFCPKFAALISCMPAATIGGVSLILYGMISAVGVRNIVENQVDFTKSRNVIIAALIIALALGINFSSALGCDTAAGVSGAVSFMIGNVKISLSGLAVASLVGIILNAVLPGNDYKFGKNDQGDQSVNFKV